MKIEWFLNQSKQSEKAKIKSMLLANRDSLEQLTKVLEKKMVEVVKPDDYDNAGWAYWQADRNGYNRAILQVIDLIKSIDEE